jgi:hypothetical protein
MAEGPVFGPYVFNGVPLWQVFSEAKNGMKFECVGRYIPREFDTKTEEIKLEVNTSYGAASDLYFKSKGSTGVKPLNSRVEFVMADELVLKDTFNKKQTSCEYMLDLPLISVLMWNSERPTLKDEALRIKLSKAIPRKGLLRSGAHYYGKTISSLILANHPGYNELLPQRNYSSKEILSEKKNKNPWQKEPLLFSSAHRDLGVAEKSILDSLRLVGVNVEFKSGLSFNEVDGFFTGLNLPWPEEDFLSDFHSAAPSEGKGFLKIAKDQSLDKLLDLYARSLTNESPDFLLLKKIHKNLYEKEIFTPILQHSLCVKIQKTKKQKLIIDNRFPDWFRDLLANI